MPRLPFLISLSLACLMLHAQQQPKSQRILLKRADELRSGRHYGKDELSILIGDVQLEHQGYELSSDSARLNQTQNRAHFYGRAHLNAGDTLHLFSDTLSYEGNTKFATATGRVRLVDKDMTITTDTLYFDGQQNIAYYRSGGRIVDQDNTLTSQRATYYIGKHEIVFQSAVHIVNPQYVIDSKKLTYDKAHKILLFNAASTIVNTRDSTRIYTEAGSYNTERDIGRLTKNPVVHYKNEDLSGDEIFYDKKAGFGSATGHVTLRAPRENISVRGGYGAYYKAQDYGIVTRNPVAIKTFLKRDQSTDKLYIHGDTISTKGGQRDGNRALEIFRHVKFFKSNLQGKCDSIHYDESSGVMQLLGDPIIWSGKNQMTADTILITTLPKTQKLDSLKLIQNAFITSKVAERDPKDKAFNQMKGHEIQGKFIQNQLRRVQVLGNAESIYYADDRKKIDPRTGKPQRIGINKMQCSSISIELKDRKMQRISCHEQPNAVLYPEQALPAQARILRDFRWRAAERPRSKGDIFK